MRQAGRYFPKSCMLWALKSEVWILMGKCRIPCVLGGWRSGCSVLSACPKVVFWNVGLPNGNVKCTDKKCFFVNIRPSSAISRFWCGKMPSFWRVGVAKGVSFNRFATFCCRFAPRCAASALRVLFSERNGSCNIPGGVFSLRFGAKIVAHSVICCVFSGG